MEDYDLGFHMQSGNRTALQHIGWTTCSLQPYSLQVNFALAQSHAASTADTRPKS